MEHSLKGKTFALDYDSGEVDLLDEFYIPALERSIKYDRVAGFFTSDSISVAARGIAGLINNNGKMRLITCPKLEGKDIQVILDNLKEDTISEIIEKELFDETRIKNDSLEALGWMLANNLLEIRIAIPSKKKSTNIDDNGYWTGIYHPKFGILTDSDGYSVAFTGSANETGAAWTKNIEEISVFSAENESVRVDGYIRKFEKHWEGRIDYADIISLPEAVEKKWIEAVPKSKGELNIFRDQRKTVSRTTTKELRQYQKDAIFAWEQNNYCGIFDMATGTGKTFTAIRAVEGLLKQKSQLAIFITCPYKHLTEMWREEAEELGIKIIIGHSESKNWTTKIDTAIQDLNIRGKPFCFICTNATFSQKSTRERINKIKGEILLVSDEVHHMGAIGKTEALIQKIKYRLGLSATVERMGDNAGTQRIIEYFGKKCIEFGIDEAIQSNMLTKYYYFPIPCYLSTQEYGRFRDINKKIDELAGMKDPDSRKKLKELKISGVTLIAKMENKIDKLLEVMKEYNTSDNILVYCGSTRVDDNDISDNDTDEELNSYGERLVDHVSNKLYEELGMRVKSFTYRDDMKRRKEIIDDFSSGKIQAMVAIRCLDEGVNIPSIRSAFILSSSDDPKEYIQRRGRVLRPSDKKEYAEIYDFIAFPRNFSEVYLNDSSRDFDIKLIEREMKRAIEFARSSKNKEDTDRLLSQIQDTYGMLQW